MNNELKLLSGGMFQEKDCLLDLLEKDKAIELESLAESKGWREVEPDEAEEMGFNELVEWSVNETDILVLIDDNYLVCIPKKFHCTAKN